MTTCYYEMFKCTIYYPLTHFWLPNRYQPLMSGIGLRTNTKKTTCLRTKRPLVWEQLSLKPYRYVFFCWNICENNFLTTVDNKSHSSKLIIILCIHYAIIVKLLFFYRYLFNFDAFNFYNIVYCPITTHDPSDVPDYMYS